MASNSKMNGTDTTTANPATSQQLVETSNQPVWSKQWLRDIPGEIRTKVYKRYFFSTQLILHACPNPGWVFDNMKTSHDFVYPDCPRSSEPRHQDDIRKSCKNLFLVSKQVKDEAYGCFLSTAGFIISSRNCLKNASFMQYPPIEHLAWSYQGEQDWSKWFEKATAIARQFASRHPLRTICLYDAPNLSHFVDEDIDLSEWDNILADFESINVKLIILDLSKGNRSAENLPDRMILISNLTLRDRPFHIQVCAPTHEDADAMVTRLALVETEADQYFFEGTIGVTYDTSFAKNKDGKLVFKRSVSGTMLDTRQRRKEAKGTDSDSD